MLDSFILVQIEYWSLSVLFRSVILRGMESDQHLSWILIGVWAITMAPLAKIGGEISMSKTTTGSGGDGVAVV